MSNKYSYVISKQAEEDIVSVMRYITETLQNQKAANDMFAKIENAIETACAFPYANPSCEYYFINDPNTRHIVIDNYALFYEIEDEENRIVILRFLLARMDFKKISVKV